MPLPERENSMQSWLFLPHQKWEINFLMGDFSQLSLSSHFLNSKNLEMTALKLYTETQLHVTPHCYYLAPSHSLLFPRLSQLLPKSSACFGTWPLRVSSQPSIQVILLVQVSTLLWTLHWLPAHQSERSHGSTWSVLLCPSNLIPLSLSTLLPVL